MNDVITILYYETFKHFKFQFFNTKYII